ncbi:MAG TPA: chemotaxis protein CheW [Spirochaetia bacterium]|nr:chemotaxis protein CheW [Spirochaetia bacterium]
MEVKAEYKAIFSEEAADQLREWEESLLALEKDPRDGEQINRMFRAIHTMKGSAGFIGYDELARVAHDLESSLQQVREGTRSFDSTAASFFFEGLDLCRAMIEGYTAGKDAGVDTKDFLDRFAAMLPPGASPAAASPDTAAGPAALERAPLPAPDGCRLTIRIDGLPREAYLRSFLVKSRLERLGTILAVDPSPESLKESTGPFVYTVTLKTAASPETLPAAISVDLVTVTLAPSESPAAGGEPGIASAGPHAARSSSLGEVVRVSVSKLDTLLNLVGELVIHNSGFEAITHQLREQYGKTPFIYDLEQKTEALSVITRDLQEGIMKARMLPVANVFNRFSRVVRDLSKASGKTVTLEIFGEETEIDKKVIDRIGEPLVHLIRNAVDHGVESPAERAASGKAAEGRVRLGAYQDGDHICIEVSDDGRGLDRAAIVAKALEKGLISPDEAPRASSERVLGFIFLPGFSTAERVSDISGRGVGMDAVKAAVEEMNGSLRVRSTPRVGTTITITLPLTMAIISAVLVEVAGAAFAIPLSSVREILKVQLGAVRTIGGRRVIMVRDEVLAMVHLGRALSDGEDPRQEPIVAGTPVVVVDYEGHKIGLEVEKIIGTREVVIKSLSRHYREIDGLIGASILGNGKIALIVDVETLVSQHYHGDGASGRARMKGSVDFEALEDRRVSPEPALEAVSAPPPPLAQAPLPAEPAAQPLQVEDVTRKVLNSQGTALEVVNNTSAIQASMSLSQFTGREVRVSFPESRLVPISEVAETLGGEEASVGGIYVEVQGDLSGGILLVLPFANLLEMDDLVHGRPPGTTTELADVDLSAMCEMGNILAASFINTMADSTDLAVAPGVPEISVDMCLSVIDSVLAHFSQPGDEILITEAVIYGSGSENVVCRLLLFLEPDSLRKLMGTLEGESASRAELG